ncbi:MAG: DUF4956 domain-containing protein [Phycisphaerales bacterium]|nr:DUF4956 domain-containing protein [Phycisphaerales bacterium]
MPEWLSNSFTSDINLSLQALIMRDLVALTLGMVVAAIYRLTCGRDGRQARSLMATLVLLTVLIAMISSVIGDNVARAFSLVGALSIVRFRTVVEDTRDTAFVIFAVGVGMAIGSGYLRIPLVCIPVAGLAAWLYRPVVDDRPSEDTLIVRTGLAVEDDAPLLAALAPFADSHRLTNVSTARQGASIERVYAVRLRPDADRARLVGAMNVVEGVQTVELRN